MRPAGLDGAVQGHVRAVLWQHLGAHAGRGGAPQGDPNDLVDASGFRDALARAGDARAQREAAHAYVTLWARTFRTLVRHLRGQPESALRLFATEVYPYLRGDRLAARVERTAPRTAEVLVHDDLPSAYVSGLVEAFVSLSRADASCEPAGGGRYAVTWHVHPADRMASLAHDLASIRVPLLLTAFLAALVGTGTAFALAGALAWPRVAVVLIGTLAAQSGANALHDRLTPRHQGPLARPGPAQGWVLFQLIGSYVVAAGALAYLVATGRPWLLAFGAAGLGLAALYRALRDRGWGPAVAALAHGPLTVWGCLYALAGPPWAHELPGAAVLGVLVTVPTGMLAAAVMFLDDMADRPLDEAAGRRTLVIRLPRRRHVLVFGLLLAAALVAWGTFILPTGPLGAGVFAAGVVAAIALTTLVARRRDDPHGLAPARIGTLTLYVAVAASLTLALLETAPWPTL